MTKNPNSTFVTGRSNYKRQKTQFERAFQRHSNIIYPQNIRNYTDNDINFLRGLNELYGNALSAKGLNLLDPIHANFFHYNKMSMRGNADYPRVTRSYVFFTRPELNFSFETINSVPFFRWLYSKKIGKMIMAALSDPDSFINAPAALNSMETLSASEIREIMIKYAEEMRAMERELNKNDPVLSRDNAADFSDSDVDEDDSARVAQINNLDIDSLSDDDAIEVLKKHQSQINSVYRQMESRWNNPMVKLQDKLELAVGGDKRDMYGETGVYKYLKDNGLVMAKYLLNDEKSIERFAYTSPFIPLLGNTCVSLSGAKDFTLETFQYEEDRHGNSMVVATGMDAIWGPGTFNTNFEDIVYSPVSLLIMTWVLYIHYVSRGYIATKRHNVTERILDYTCSAYVFVIGDNGRKIERWAQYTGCFPTNFPLTSQLDHNTQIEQDMLQKISINWQYNAYSPMDPSTFVDFNFLSESEWLCKLKDPLWENLYSRTSSVKQNAMYETLFGDKDTLDQQMKRSILKRPKDLWHILTPNEVGMSGYVPATLISGSHTNMINDYWGGFPYIVNGGDLIWVMPHWVEADPMSEETAEEDRKTVSTPGHTGKGFDSILRELDISKF